ncbi:hypothetical protein [Sphingomonas mesophila]|uniref:hypothetical protein n=1 Tax=Sphingomonas mesophila TaxID=2303576 RepID=UPI0013C2AAEE|nr:hypothetical protein [Sphingomonas mesophila]
MRFLLVPLLALALAGCGGTKQTYQAPVTDSWSKLTGAAYAAAGFGLPVGLAGADVRATFESFPGERTGYWKFTRRGKELGRLNVAVEGDGESSSVSYDYVTGEVAEGDKKTEALVRQYARPLIVEAVDSALANRPRDEAMRRHADAQTTTAMMGQLFQDVDSSLEEAVERFDEQDRQRKRSAANRTVREASTNATKPMVTLGGGSN